MDRGGQGILKKGDFLKAEKNVLLYYYNYYYY